MTDRALRLVETFDAIDGPLARLGRSLRDDRDAVLKVEVEKTGADLLATDAFLQRFSQTVDLALRKLFPRLLAAIEETDTRHPFGAMLDRLDGYEMLTDVPWWIQLNEIRNRLVHEYAMSPDDRWRELTRAWQAAERFSVELARMCEGRRRSPLSDDMSRQDDPA